MSLCEYDMVRMVRAAESKDLQQVERFLDGGLDINCLARLSSQFSYSALMIASKHGHDSVVEYLLSMGASVNLDNNGWTALHFASSNGHLSTVELLLQNGADVTLQNKYGSTPLHICCDWDHITIAEVLIRHGADPTERSKELGKTPLECCRSVERRIHLESMFEEMNPVLK